MRLFCLQIIIGLSISHTAVAELWGSLRYNVAGLEVHIIDCDNNALGEIIIPREIEGFPVTTIKEKAFWNCASITGVRIPNTVTEIERMAFESCKSLL